MKKVHPNLIFNQSPHSKKYLSRTQPVLEDKPTYLEVPHFQRVSITGDYAAGVRSNI